MTVTVNSGLMTVKNDTSSEDPLVRKAGIEHCTRVIEACADMGSPYWSGLMHSAWGLKPDSRDPLGYKQKTWDRAVTGMKQVAGIAGDAGVVCAIEVVNRYDHFLLNTAKDAIRFCKEVAHPYCKVLLDVFHMSIEEDNLADAIVETQKSGELACIHVGETNRRIPTGGPTNINWKAFGQAVRDSGYEGNLVLEPLAFAGKNGSGNTCIWRNVADPGDVAKLIEDGRKAMAFLRDLTK